MFKRVQMVQIQINQSTIKSQLDWSSNITQIDKARTACQARVFHKICYRKAVKYYFVDFFLSIFFAKLWAKNWTNCVATRPLCLSRPGAVYICFWSFTCLLISHFVNYQIWQIQFKSIKQFQKFQLPIVKFLGSSVSLRSSPFYYFSSSSSSSSSSSRRSSSLGSRIKNVFRWSLNWVH